jgi:hypothetical protein
MNTAYQLIEKGMVTPYPKDLGESTFHELKVCLLCGQTSVFWNWFTKRDHCFNPDCLSYANRSAVNAEGSTAAIVRERTEPIVQIRSKWATLLTGALISVGIGLIVYSVLGYNALGVSSFVIAAASTILTTWNLLTLILAYKDRQHIRFSEITVPAALATVMVLIEIAFGFAG